MATKKTNYFPHDSNARNDTRLVNLRMRHHAAGYGVYFMILERLREEADYTSAKDYNAIAFDLREDAALIKSVVEDFGLFAFTEDGKRFYSESFNRRMEEKDSVSQKRREAIRKRWSNTNAPDNDTNVLENNTNVSENGYKESKEKKIKETPEGVKKSAPRFLPPTREDVLAYAKEKNIDIDAERFVNFYESKGWMVGKTGMKDWRAAVRGWVAREKQEANGPNYARDAEKPKNRTAFVVSGLSAAEQKEEKMRKEAREKERILSMYMGLKDGTLEGSALKAAKEMQRNGVFERYGLP